MPSSPIHRAHASISEHEVVHLSPDITVVHPGARRAEGHADNPALVLLFGWTAAPESPLQKYVEGHTSVFPAATVVVVRVHAGFFFRTIKAREAVLQPLLDYLTERFYDQTKKPSGGVLIHALSNGGVLQLMTLHGMLRRRFPPKSQDIATLTKFPVALVVDSAPGDSQYASMLSFFTIPMRTRIARLATTAAFSLAYVVYASITTALGVDFFAEMHAFMAETSVLPGHVGATPRLYVYSDNDEMVRAKVVEEHVRRVRGLGYTVRVKKFVGSRHVQHARSDPDRYWGAIRETWFEACKCGTQARL
ncbi:hypothetical protein CCMSSC00406_0007976 [Pleurotus cornucopiae]|uniref:Uncharacterized protein n=1 Tax=Pleurotus cornucopiae TaxID=5321 RepID=A0ACB7IJP3_PLECO|nr:hypothetical protein CCMSSC00406_0007976 [Pleurotus cornucopiae]